MYALYDQGVDEYGNEITQQGGAADDPGEERRGRDRSYILALALTAGALLADRMANAWAAEVIRQMRGQMDGGALTERLLGLSGRLLEDLANQGANVALATGRAAMGEANAGIVEKEIYTAIIDGATCRGGPLQCLEQDGTEYPVGEGVPCPNPSCFGADRCRCLRVPVVAGVGQ